MKANWKQVPRGDVAVHTSGTYATINPRGVIVINRWTYERLGSPGSVLLLFDQATNRIGLQPTASLEKDAYRVLMNGGSGARKINALRLVREFGVDVNETLQFKNPEIDEDGILVLDLRTARLSRRSANHATKRPDRRESANATT